MAFPDKSLREKCWASRDEFWKCLDANDDKLEACAAAREFYTTFCPRQWVQHFDRKREYLKFKQQIETDGYQPTTTESSSAKS